FHVQQAGVVVDAPRRPRHAILRVGAAAVRAANPLPQIVYEVIGTVGARGTAWLLLIENPLHFIPQVLIHDGRMRTLFPPLTELVMSQVDFIAEQIGGLVGVPYAVSDQFQIVADARDGAACLLHQERLLHILLLVGARHKTLRRLLCRRYEVPVAVTTTVMYPKTGCPPQK